MSLILKPPGGPWPALAAWLAADFDALRRDIVLRALQDDGVLEYDPGTQAFGTNRSPYLDALCRWAGSPLGSYWCAIWAGRVFADAGAMIPQDFPATDTWMPYLETVASVPVAERVGCAVLYGVRGSGPVAADYRAMKATGWDAKHIGIVTRWVQYRAPGVAGLRDFVLTTEGNRGYAGSATNNGLAVDTAPLTRPDVLGLVRPRRSV